MSNTPNIRFKGFSDAWEQRKLGDCLSEITYGFTNPMSDTEDGPWKLTAKDIVNGKIDYSSARHTSQIEYESLTDKSKPLIGDLLLTKDGTLGRTAIVDTENICINQSVALLRFNEKCSAQYAKTLLDTPMYQKQMLDDAGGGTIKHIYITKVDKMFIPVPSMREQEQLVCFFDNLDNLITLHQHKYNEMLILKRYLLQKMFPKRGRKVPEIRFDGFKEEWKQYKCKDIFDKVGVPVKLKKDGLYREIGIRSHGKGIFHKDEVTGAEIGNKRVFWIEQNCFILNIVFAWERAVAKTTKNEIGMIASHRFPMYKPKTGIVDLDYITKFFITDQGKDILEMASPGGAGRNKTLGQKEFAESNILIPSYEEQIKIGETIKALDELINLNLFKYEKLKEIKKYMLKNMFV